MKLKSSLSGFVLLFTLAAAALAASTGGAQTTRCATSTKGEHVASFIEHGGGLNSCGCHFNRQTGACHCHQASSCGCECQPATCPRR
jgi:hypothetical protein